MSLPALSPAQTVFVKHLNGLAPLATCVVTPLVADLQFRRAGVPTRERKMLVFQEVVRQGISGVIGLSTYYGGMLLTGHLFKGADTRKTLAQIIGGTAMSFVGYGFIRPMVSSEIIARWLRQWQGGEGVVSPVSARTTQPSAANLQQQRFDGFVSQIQARTFR